MAVVVLAGGFGAVFHFSTGAAVSLALLGVWSASRLWGTRSAMYEGRGCADEGTAR
jgi:hypothetical protein